MFENEIYTNKVPTKCQRKVINFAIAFGNGLTKPYTLFHEHQCIFIRRVKR